MKGEIKSMNELLTVQDLQKLLKISRSKAYELANTPDFPTLRIGKVIRIPKDQLQEWIKENVS